MTEKKTAGYFDQKRNCPMYEGDVYVLPFEDPEFFKIVKPETEGFRVRQVGTSEEFALSEIGRRFVEEGRFIGNEFENPHTIDDYIAEKKASSEETAVSSIEEKIAAVENANEELKESNERLKENIATMFEAPSEEKDEEHEQICSTDSDVTAAENGTSTDELQEDGTGSDSSTNSEEPAKTTDDKPTEEGAVSAEATTGKNVIVEVAKEAIPEVIANTKDEKNAIMRKKFLKNLINKNHSEIITLQEKVEYNNNLASTLDFEPFVKLKHIVTEAIHSNVDDENIKGIKDRTKDFESIVNIQNLLKEYKQKALDAEQHIADLEDEISKFEDELAELEAKIDTFARQEKLPLDSVTKNN